MFAIEVNFLTGRFTAAAHHDRARPEWPPHPARLFSALVAVWADVHPNDPDDPLDPAEKQAIEWLESQPSPSICASDAAPRRAVGHFVPVNDARVIAAGAYQKRADKIDQLAVQIEEARSEGLPKELKKLQTALRKERNISSLAARAGQAKDNPAVDMMPPGWVTAAGQVRTGQARIFPSVTPDDPRVTYLWETNPADGVARTIDGLCTRLTRLGHSSSLVSCRVVRDFPAANHIPGDGGEVMRSVRSGQLKALEREYAKHKGSKPRTLPFTPVRYRRAEPASGEATALEPATAGEWLVFAFLPGSRALPSTRAVDVATALRGALLHHAADPIPEGLSGHRREGRPSTIPHAAFLPLPWVQHEQADGRLMGAAVNMPEGLDDESRRALLRAVGRWEAGAGQNPLVLTLGRKGRLKMERITGPSPLVTLRPGLWRRSSHRWASALPIALPAHPGPLGKGTPAARAKAWAKAEQAVTASCRHVGLPEPAAVEVSLTPFIRGARPAPSFPAFLQGAAGGKQIARRLVHAALTFDRPVSGPLMLGAGRYLGLGLMRPLPERKPDDA